MTQLISAVAAFVALATGMAMLHDTTPRPADTSPRGWFRHVLRMAVLVAITASAGVLLLIPRMRGTSLYEVAFHCALAAFMAIQAPCPWWRYVTQGRAAP
ncbi:MAG TPA: hypothetical protein VFH59_07870 [Frateuria sp.]|uniref:hypothetical protein n=1 Tax=Frateuria sp. TaxID=2211372 RepID=UPI002D7E6128|nr:hypothetical protein [Frateuria sp.]HET6805339.1 hypothetical protein [Frateuria sp.]